MFTFKFIRGTTRFVIVVNDEFVIKIAHPFNMVEKIYRENSFYELKERRWDCFLVRSIYLWCICLLENFWHSFCANLVEGYCYIRLGKSLTFLTPTFTFGLFNIQPYISGSVPKRKDTSEFIKRLFFPEGVYDFLCMDHHETDPVNWKVTSDGRLMLLDYGGISNDGNTLPKLFFKYLRQITERLAAQV
jgi:hypothetical protein